MYSISSELYENVTSKDTLLARRGLRASLEFRTRRSLPSWKPVCIYDLAEEAAVEVKFCPETSLGGMYDNISKTILIPSKRPAGRKAFSCAHELGHWHFGDGVSVDELGELENWHISSPKEILANHFAAGLLMPNQAVMRSFTRRGWEIQTPTAIQIFVVAGQLGVGYSTLVNHLHRSLRKIKSDTAKRLLATTPKQIRKHLIGLGTSDHLIVADRFWEIVPIDLSVGDYAILPNSIELDECPNLELVSSPKNGIAVRATQPGLGRAWSKESSWSSFVRVSRKNYEGRSKFRHLEENDN